MQVYKDRNSYVTFIGYSEFPCGGCDNTNTLITIGDWSVAPISFDAFVVIAVTYETCFFSFQPFLSIKRYYVFF